MRFQFEIKKEIVEKNTLLFTSNTDCAYSQLKYVLLKACTLQYRYILGLKSYVQSLSYTCGYTLSRNLQLSLQ